MEKTRFRYIREMGDFQVINVIYPKNIVEKCGKVLFFVQKPYLCGVFWHENG